MANVLTKIFGSRNERLLKQYARVVARINALESGIAALSDEALRAKTAEFRKRLQERVAAAPEGERDAAEQAIRASVQYAFDHPDASREYVRAHAQEMSEAVCAQHIALYVNEHSLDVGDEGMAAIARLVAADSPGAAVA